MSREADAYRQCRWSPNARNYFCQFINDAALDLDCHASILSYYTSYIYMV